MKQRILKDMEEWFKNMTTIYSQIKFRYEFLIEDDIYKIVYYTDAMLSNDKNFIMDVLRFEDYMNEAYGIKAPLFCENENLFSLSE